MFNPSELGSNDLNDYKNSKAFSFYKTGWLQKLSYHCISEESPFCAIKGECRHSQRINDTSHKLWLIIEKENAKIRSCHCTCMAGMSQTCNHVAGAIFRIEAAVRMGLSNPACTMVSNQWLPNRKDVLPVKIKNLDFSRENFSQHFKKKDNL